MSTEPSVRSPLTLEDLTSDLLWPRLLRAPALGLNPGRLVLAFLGIIVLAVVLQFGLWIDAGIKGTPTPERIEVVRAYAFDVDFAAENLSRATTLWRTICSLPKRAVQLFPVTTIVAFPIAMIIWLTILTAICRSAACEVAQGLSLSWPQSLGFALGGGRWKSVLGAFLLPLLAIYLILVAIAASSAILFRIPVLNLLGGLLFGLMLLGAMAAAIIAFCFTLAKGLLIPAIACDGADAFDAVQRAFAYVLGRPLRLIVYLAISALVALLAILLALSIAATAGGLAFQAAFAWSGTTGRTTLLSAALPVFDNTNLPSDVRSSAGVTGTFAATAAILRFWFGLLGVLVASYAVSTIACAMTQVYLLLRRANDGQDISEIWMPGMVGGTLATAQASSNKPNA